MIEELLRRSDALADAVGMDRDEFFCRIYCGDPLLLEEYAQLLTERREDEQARPEQDECPVW